MPLFMSPEELLALELTSRNHAVLDVRERYEYDSEHIPGSFSLPRGMLELAVNRVCPARDVPLMLYCDEGERSSLASKVLGLLGYEDIRVLSGGINAWRGHDLPCLKGNSLTAKIHAEKLAARGEVRFIDPDELAKRLKEQECVVIDTRTKAEYEVGHVPGAYWAGGDIAECALSATHGEQTPVVMHCAGRTRSILASYVLRQYFGLEHVFSLRNGTMAWQMAGFPLEPGPAPGRPEIKTEATKRAAEIACGVCERSGLTSITPRRLGELFSRQTPCYVFDVRPGHDYLAKHIRGSVSCEAGQMALRADDLIGMAHLPVILCSDSQVRSIIAGLLLKNMGYGDVRVLEGGIDAWGEDGLLLETGQPELNLPEPITPSGDIAQASVEELQSSLERSDPVTIVDVRSAGEFAPRHIRGSTWIPRGQLESWAGELLANTRDPQGLVVICDNGHRSLLAASTLGDMGYGNVRFLAGGLNAWSAKGLGLEIGWSSAKAPLAMVKAEIPPAQRVGPLARTHGEMVAYLESEEGLSRL